MKVTRGGLIYLSLCVWASICAGQSLEVDERGPDVIPSAYHYPPRHKLTHAERMADWDGFFWKRVQDSCVVLCHVGLEDDMRRPLRITIKVKEPRSKVVFK